MNDPRPLKIDRIHHVAYRCKDAKQTVEWYGRMLKMDFMLAIAEDRTPLGAACELPAAGDGSRKPAL